jgi:DMSO/TMAO reductase YedYZ molybdopterin-dependent catalytic subunit
VAVIEDVLADDVLLAERLDGRPLDGDHGAPLRLVSPGQYGFVSTKHLCRIELHASEPTDLYASPVDRLLAAHPRARVRQEERHRHLPARVLRVPYRLLIPPIRHLSARGSGHRSG